MPNIYYNPEGFGLEQVASIDYSSGSYKFDTRVVWKLKGHFIFYTMRDSGRSCPTPFEDYNMDNIDRLDFDTPKREVQEELAEHPSYVSPGEAQEFLEKVRNAAAVK